jgi:hypothetical protein
MLFRADNVNLKMVFIPARSAITSDELNLSKRQSPLPTIETLNLRREPSIASGKRADSSALITFFSPESLTTKAAERTLEVNRGFQW